MIIIAGYPAEDATVPVITKEPLENIATFLIEEPASGPAGRVR